MRIKFSNLGKVGIIKDIPEQELPPEVFTDARNVRFTSKGISAMRGDRRAMATGLVEAKWLVQVPPSDNPLWVYGDETKLCVYDGTSHTDITRVAQAYSGDATQRWTGTLFSGLLVVNNTVDVPQVWTSFSTGTPMIDLPNWPGTLRCRFLRSFKSFLIAGGLSDGGQRYPFRLRWSHPAAPGSVPASWVTNNPAFDSRQVDLGETDDVLVDSLPLGDINVIYREKSAWGMQFVGGQDKFRFWKLLSEDGLLWRDCVQSIPKGHVVMGQNDIYFHTGQVNSSQSLIHNTNRDWFFKLISPENFFNCFTMKNSPAKEVWFCVPESGSQYATLALTWNYVDGSIGFRDLPGTPYGTAGVLSSENTISESWGE